MIDTIRLVLDGVAMPIGWDDEKWTQIETHRGNRSSYRRELKTSTMYPMLKHVRVYYSDNEQKLSVECSLPKLMHGHNATEMVPSNLPVVAQRLDFILLWAMSDYWGQPLAIELPSVTEWVVQRIDMNFDFKPQTVPFAAARKGCRRTLVSGGF